MGGGRQTMYVEGGNLGHSGVHKSYKLYVSLCRLWILYRKHVVSTIAAWMSECGQHPGCHYLKIA